MKELKADILDAGKFRLEVFTMQSVGNGAGNSAGSSSS
jgi:hypothetical protein